MRGSRSITLENLGEHLSSAKEKLSVEKKDILKIDALPEGFNREEYAFAYMRAERTGMAAITSRLAEIAWLPMQLDPGAELVADNRSPMKRWLTALAIRQPGAEEFGNDFIHALTRSAMRHGWDAPATRRMLLRITGLFRDLSCLIAMIYFTSWLAERDIEGIALTDPDDLYRSVVEVAAIVQSPELQKALRARAEEMRRAKASKSIEKAAKKSRPPLRLVRNEGEARKDESFLTDPLPA